MLTVQAAIGFIALVGLCWAISENRKAFPVKLVASCAALQFALAAGFLYLPGIATVFAWINSAVLALSEATRAGTSFVFGFVGGGTLPFETLPQASSFILAFQALPIILVISALSALLFHWGIIPAVVRAGAWALRKTIGIDGAEAVCAIANIFVGMVEAPILVGPYLKRLDRSGLFLVMTVGMATIAGTVFALYALFLGQSVPDAAGHLLAASVISVPAAILVARIIVPRDISEDGTTPDAQDPIALTQAEPAAGAMDAIVRGTAAGVSLLISITALLLVMVALVALVDLILAGLLPAIGGADLSVERIFGWLFAPVALAMGIPWAEAAQAGALLGTKTALNELLAYLSLSQIPPESLGERTRLILTYALCGFANFGSLGIMLGGLTVLIPERRAEVLQLGLKSLLSGTVVTCLTGATIGVLI